MVVKMAKKSLGSYVRKTIPFKRKSLGGVEGTLARRAFSTFEMSVPSALEVKKTKKRRRKRKKKR